MPDDGVDPWGPVDPEVWRDVPYIEGRAATEADVVDGRAVFYISGGGSRFVSGIELPALADLRLEDGTTERVIVIQIEGDPSKDSVVAVGYRTFEGGNGVAMLDEFEFVDLPPPEKGK